MTVRVPGHTLDVVRVLRDRVDQSACSDVSIQRISVSVSEVDLTSRDVVNVGHVVDASCEDVRPIRRPRDVVDLLPRLSAVVSVAVSLHARRITESGLDSPEHRLQAPALLLVRLVLDRLAELVRALTRNPEQDVAICADSPHQLSDLVQYP
mgnify:CR=1 FL=1